MEQYSKLAKCYDKLNADFDYKGLASFLASEIKENESVNTSLVLDLACGTGKLTFLLRELGYDMTGVDLSEEMLMVARDISFKKGIDNILWLNQDMTDFELYGTVDACVCTLDSLNYLTSIKDLEKCLSLVKNYLIPDGVFVFDLNTPYRFEKVYSDNSFVLEDDDTFLVWQNQYSKRSKICDFYLSIFERLPNGTYERQDEMQRERCYSMKQIKSLLDKFGFEIIHVYGDFDKSPVCDESEKWYFTVRNKKENLCQQF